MWLTDAQWLLPLKSVVTDVISVERKKHTACSQLKILSSRPQPARENWNRELNGAEQQMSPWEITLVPLKIVFLSLGLKSSLHPFSSTVSLERTKQRFLLFFSFLLLLVPSGEKGCVHSNWTYHFTKDFYLSQLVLFVADNGEDGEVGLAGKWRRRKGGFGSLAEDEFGELPHCCLVFELWILMTKVTRHARTN